MVAFFFLFFFLLSSSVQCVRFKAVAVRGTWMGISEGSALQLRSASSKSNSQILI